MTITLICNDTELNVEALVGNYRLREIFHNNLKQADNSLSLAAVFTIELANFLKANIQNDIKCVVSENGSNIYTGYVRKNINFQKTQVNKPIGLEIVSPSFLLNKTLDRGFAYIDKTLAYTVTDLVQKAGFTSIRSLTPLGYTPKLITVKKDENIKQIITQLLWEYGYTWDFDADGFFFVSPLFDIPATSDITQAFDGTNCLDQIQITAKEQEADSVEATYSKIEEHLNTLIFRDTTNANGSYECQQEIGPQSYFAGKQYNYLNLDSTFGQVLYATNLRSDVKADSTQISWNASLSDLAPDTQGQNLINQVCFTAHNGDTRNAHNLSRIEFYADAYVASSTSVSKKSYGNKKSQKVQLKYIGDETHADAFCRNYTEWMRWASNTITLKSKENFALGSFVFVSDYGIGTYYGRIIQKQSSLVEAAISYTIESLTEFTPAEVDTTQSSSNNLMGAIEGARENAFAYTDSAIAQVVLENSPRYLMRTNSAIIKKTADGTYSPAKIIAEAKVLNGDQSEDNYTGTFHVYINGSSSEWGLPYVGSRVELSLASLAEQFNEINSIQIVLKSNSDAVLIDEENIPVLANPNAYSILIENGFNAFTCDDTGKVSAQSVQCSPHVYYGLQEVPYGPDGWEFTQLPVEEGFIFVIDSDTGKITVSTVDGAVIPDNGSIPINLFVHSSTDETFNIGYVADREEVYIGYIDGGASVEVGFTQPSEDGTITCYFNYSKLSELGLLLKREDSPSSPNYGEMTLNGAKIKVASIQAESIAANAITADKIKAGAITSDKINTTELFATDINATNMHLSGNSTIDGVLSAQDLIIRCKAGKGYTCGTIAQPWFGAPTYDQVHETRYLYLPVSGTLRLNAAFSVSITGPSDKYFIFDLEGLRKNAQGQVVADSLWSNFVTGEDSNSIVREIPVGEADGGYFRLTLYFQFKCKKETSRVDYMVQLECDKQNWVLLSSLIQWQ